MSRKQKPDLILLDLAMPDLSGFDVLAKLRDDKETSGIPVIICTSRVLTEEDRSRLAGAVDVVPKENVSREVAYTRLSEALAKAGLGSAEGLVDSQVTR